MRKPCRKSGKVKFKTHEQALQRAGEIITSVRNFTRIAAMRAYQCEHCDQWHLTKRI